MNWSIILLAAVTAERLGALWLARNNTRRLISQGAFEVAAAHYPLIFALHAAWLVGLWAIAWNAPLQLGWVPIFAVLQLFRIWTLSTLGRRWTTCIIVVPGKTLVSAGPYRFIRHPN
jgi:methyltransferase